MNLSGGPVELENEILTADPTWGGIGSEMQSACSQNVPWDCCLNRPVKP